MTVSSHGRVEIRLLGPTTVRRTDGSLVAAREWRTAKTLDLLRLLALEHDVPVRAERLVDLLWPDVDSSRGRASLRTAASQLRRVLGPECVERTTIGLVLHHAWVDAVAFRSLASHARDARRAGLPARTVADAWEAEGLYLGDFRGHDDDSDWAHETRSGLLNLRRSVLSDAAEAAVELGWFRDALDLAARLVAVEPTHEGAHRVLMAAHAGLGSRDEALRTYETLRSRLDEELGATPSASSRELHARVLGGTAQLRPSRAGVGQEAPAAELTRLLLEPESPVVLVLGRPGSGREHVVRAACAAASRRLSRIDVHGRSTASRHRLPRQTATPRERPTSDVGLLLLDDLPLDEQGHQVDTVLGGPGAPRTTVVVVDGEAGIRRSLDRLPHPVDVVAVEPLTDSQLTELATQVLGAEPHDDLMRSVRAESDGLAGVAVHQLETLLRAGRVRWSPEGVTLLDVDSSTTSTGEISGLLRLAVDGADDRSLDLIQLMACVDSPMSVESLSVLLADISGNRRGPVDIRSTVERLTDLGVLRMVEAGVAFHSQAMRAATAVWMRPMVRAHLHLKVAQSEVLPSLARLQHWLAAGSRLEAVDFAVVAATRALADADLPLARELARRADELVSDGTLLTTEAGGLRERLEHLRATLSGQPDALSDTVDETDRERSRPVLDAAELSALIEVADQSGPDIARVQTRLDYVGAVLLPVRALDRAHQLLREAEGLATSRGEVARAASWRHLPDVLLGHATAAQSQVARLRGWSNELTPDVAHDVAMLDCLVAHQVGRHDLGDLLNELRKPGRGALGIDANTVTARVLLMRERLSEAEAALADAPIPPSPLGGQFRALVRGAVQARRGHREAATATLRRAQETALETDCRLLLPEILARLIVLTAADDIEGARRDFELFDEVVDAGRTVGAEVVYRLVARSAIRLATGQPDRAIDPLTTATEVAASLEHPLLAAHCHLAAAECLDHVGRAGEAQVHRSLAGRYFRQAGLAHGPTRSFDGPHQQVREARTASAAAVG